ILLPGNIPCSVRYMKVKPFERTYIVPLQNRYGNTFAGGEFSISTKTNPRLTCLVPDIFFIKCCPSSRASTPAPVTGGPVLLHKIRCVGTHAPIVPVGAHLAIYVKI